MSWTELYMSWEEREQGHRVSTDIMMNLLSWTWEWFTPSCFLVDWDLETNSFSGTIFKFRWITSWLFLFIFYQWIVEETITIFYCKESYISQYKCQKRDYKNNWFLFYYSQVKRQVFTRHVEVTVTIAVHLLSLMPRVCNLFYSHARILLWMMQVFVKSKANEN